MPTEAAAQLREAKLKNYVADQLRNGTARMEKMQEDIDEVKQDVVRIREDMSSILEAMMAMKLGIKYIGYIGALVKWVGGIALGFAAIHALWEKFFK